MITAVKNQTAPVNGKELGQSPQDPRFIVNQSASLSDIGALVSRALGHFENDDPEIARECVFDIYSLIYPKTSHSAPPAENAALAAGEPGELSANTRDVLAGLKIFTYLGHIDRMLEHGTHRMESGTHEGMFALSGEDRATVGYLLNDVKNCLESIGGPFREAQQLHKFDCEGGE